MLNQRDIENILTTSYFGRYLFVFQELDSTNSYARRLVDEGAPEGTTVLADYQHAGRGRFGHTWQSSPGANILMSIILRPRISVESVQNITLATANILIDCFHKFLHQEKAKDFPCTVKWPNDILVQGRKLAGILCESGMRNKSIEFVIVGIGINVNQDIAELEDALRESSTSFYAESGMTFSREKLIALILKEFEKKYIEVERIGYGPVIREWKKNCLQIGQKVSVETPLGKEAGKFLDLDEYGLPLYQTVDGTIKKMATGRIKAG
jgi:BirA family transcriptional regulator, biotin operon repressor / biotin---[acetyl-CoA-carboxylase] ligase